MTNNPSTRFLNRALWLDAAASGAIMLLLLATPTPLAAWLGLPAALVWYTGLILIPWVAFLVWAATREQPASTTIWTIVFCNLAWVVASALLLLSGWLQPTMLGYAFVIAQAVAVAGFTELQYIGIRKWHGGGQGQTA